MNAEVKQSSNEAGGGGCGPRQKYCQLIAINVELN